MNYLQHGSEWSAFLGQLREAVLGRRPPLTYGNDPLGMVVVDGKLHGEPSIYPYYNTLNKACFLDAVLRYPDGNGQTAAELLRQRGIELRMEPGRSLLDQVGVTVAQVAFRRKDTSGELLVGLEMNRTQLRSSSADFLVDPIHIPLLQQEGEVSVYDGYLVGSYCLEQELILKRKIRFNGYPRIGDIFVFPNTAGYLMHFYESEAHLFSLAANVIFDPHTNHLVPDAQWET